jgi:hypothetical protein
VSHFEIVFSTDNAAFDDERAEIARILHQIADDVPHQLLYTDEPVRIRDINGNRVGFYVLKGER